MLFRTGSRPCSIFSLPRLKTSRTVASNFGSPRRAVMTRASPDDFEEVSEAARPDIRPEQRPSTQNAFAELMRPKPKQPAIGSKETDRRSLRTMMSGRDGLKQYTDDPESFPQSRVVYYNDKFVVINDMFPKATVHLLILPRDHRKNVMRPQEAFDDPVFLAECQQEEQRVRKLVASELRRKLGRYSAAEQARLEAMDVEEIADDMELPSGRDWSSEVMTGTHANPSMNHLHIHVLSKDLYSECMKKRNHYQSFTTDFFIRMGEYPLPEDDPRREYRHFPDDMHCWRCGRNFHNKMAQLKQHLEEEFEAWRKE